MATIATGYHQTVVTAPTAPSASSAFDYDLNFPLYREIVARNIIDEPELAAELDSATSFFTGQNLIQADFLMSNLQYGQELIVKVKKDQNPFSLVKSNKLNYTAVGTCHNHIDLNCTISCINTLPSFEELRFRFDCEYTYGVRMCVKNKDFWTTEFFTKQYALSQRAYRFVRENDLWNTVIDGLVTAPATTVDVALAKKHATHFWDALGTVTTSARCVVPEAVAYMRRSFSMVNPTVFVTEEFVTELVKSVETQFNLGLTNTRVNTYQQWNFPGYMLADRAKEILGLNVPVVVLQRSPWMTTTSEENLSTKYPLWNDNATKQYVAILDPRVGYSFEKKGFSLNIKPYDCDKLYAGMIDTVYTGSGITFPQFGMVLAFSPFEYC